MKPILRVLTIVVALASQASAYSAGISTDSFGINGCNECHNGGNDPSVQILGPEFVQPLSTHEYTLRIGVPEGQPYGGLNVSTATGDLGTGGAYSTQTQLMAGSGINEITHTSPKLAKGAFVLFSFLWQAPGAFSSATFDAWGNAVNLSHATDGDHASEAVFTVENGNLDACPAAPAGCPAAAKTGLALNDGNEDSKDSLAFSWTKGPAVNGVDFGDPTASADYYLCLYKDSTKILELDVHGATTCGTKPCWSVKGDPLAPKGYQYKDRLGTPHGVNLIKLGAGLAGKSKVSLKARGLDLPDITGMPFGGSTVTVELHNTATSTCFGDSYSGAEVTKDDGNKYKAKGLHP